MQDLKKRLLLLFLLLSGVANAFSQLDAERSQYMDNLVAVNPACVASNDLFNLMGTYRLQWAGFSDAPVNMFFSLNGPISIAGTKHGVGLSFYSDKVGLFNNQSVLLQYSYKMKFHKGILSFGLNLGGASFSFDGSSVDLTGGAGALPEFDDYHKESDPLVASSEVDEVALDMGFGVYYQEDDYYAGFSVAHLNRGSFKMTETSDVYLQRIYYLTGGYNISLSNPFYVLKPSALLKTDFSSYQMDLSMLVEYKKKFTAGFSLRWRSCLVFMAQYDLLGGLSVGYSYDLPTSKMIVSGGSHEFSLRYSFKPEFSKKNKYKSERIL